MRNIVKIRIGYAAQERDEESRYFAMGARQYDCTIRNNSPLEGWQTKSDGVESSKKNQLPLFYYFSLPKNKNLIEKAKELRKAGNLSEVIFGKHLKIKSYWAGI